MDDEDLIEVEDMVVTVTHGGYVKRTPLSAYRTQNRGGKGRSGMAMKDEDFIVRVFTATTHTEILFFSSAGMVYKEKVWRLPWAGQPRAARRWSTFSLWPRTNASKACCHCRKTKRQPSIST
jgi:DNA gyrase/topoisomerase IV subunit A